MAVAHQALELIARIFHKDEKLKDLSNEERLKHRQIASNSFLPKGTARQGLKYCPNNEKQLKIFLENGDVPIANSASERDPSCLSAWAKELGDYNLKRVMVSVVAYSIAENAKLNQLRLYDHFKYLLLELPYCMNNNGNIDPSTSDDFMPWSKCLSGACYKRR